MGIDVDKELLFSPAFKNGESLLPCAVQEDGTGIILMLAYVNDAALQATLRSGRATFYSRSRQKLWVKGETSGNYLTITDILVDCDQDSFVYRVRRVGGGACHTKGSDGAHRLTCFYRRLASGTLEFV